MPLLYTGPYSQAQHYDQWGNITYREGWGGESPTFTATYTNNRRNGLTYDAAGNLIADIGQNYTYDATGQQATASYTGYLLQQSYNGDGLRVKKNETGTVTYYLRSTVLGGQVVAEINGSGSWQRGYVYLGGQLLAVQQTSAVSWVHEDPVSQEQARYEQCGECHQHGRIRSVGEEVPIEAVTLLSSHSSSPPIREMATPRTTRSKTRAQLGGTGLTSSRLPFYNFVASDFASDSRTSYAAFMAAQIHEIGNSLSFLTGKEPRAKNPNLRRFDRDAGMALEECVFGGYVKPNGSVTTKP